MRCIHLQIEEIKRIAFETFQIALEEFYSPPVPSPKIVYKRFGKHLIDVQHDSWDVILNISKCPQLPPNDLKKFFLLVWRKVISYYVVCPYDIESATEILVSAVSKTNEVIGLYASNLLIEMIVLGYLSRFYRDDLIWFYKSLFVKIKTINGSEILIPLIMERLLDTDIVSEKIKEEINSTWYELSERILRIILSGGILSRELWPEKSGKIAKLIEETFLEKRRGELKKLFNYSNRVFLRDSRKPDILLSTISVLHREDISDMDTIRSSIVRSSIKNERDIVRATPAIESLGVFKKPKEIVRYWYRERARKKIRIRIENPKKIDNIGTITSPEIWQITDPIESLDIVLSISTFPKMIPNLTTKKWRESISVTGKKKIHFPDILIIIDSSGSMGYYTGWIQPALDKKSFERRIMKKLGLKYLIGSKFDIAVVAAFAIIEYAIAQNSNLAVINFSGKSIVCKWTNKRENIEDHVMIYQGNGTELPVKKIREIVGLNKNKLLVILITDSEIYNEKEAISCLRELHEKGHEIYIFHIEKKGGESFLKQVSEIGKVIHVYDINSLVDVIIGQVRQHYVSNH